MERATLELEAVVEAALRHYRRGDWVNLAQSPLAETTLVAPYYLDGEPSRLSEQAQAVEMILRWAIRRVRPIGEPDWYSPMWRAYLLLYHYYLRRDKVAEVAEKFAIAEQTFFDWRPLALHTVVEELRDGLDDQIDVEGRRHVGIMMRYDAASAEAQILFRLLAILPPGAGIARSWIATLLPAVTREQLAEIAKTESLLRESNEQLWLPERVCQAIMPLITKAEQKKWQRILGQLFAEKQDHLSAADCWYKGSDAERAASCLIDHQQALLDDLTANALLKLIQSWSVSAFKRKPEQWMKLMLVAGNSAESIGNLETAAHFYGQARAAQALSTRAQAWYKCAHLLQKTDLDECLAHYAVCIDLLERHRQQESDELSPNLQQLLSQMYIDRTWIFIQERPDSARAIADLAAAERSIPIDDDAMWSRYYGAQAGVAHWQKAYKRAIELRQQAWVSATASNNIELMMGSAHNLGQAYFYVKQYAQALIYLKRSQELAIDATNKQLEGITYKAIGACYFLQGQYNEAIVSYDYAHAIFSQTNNLNWLTGVAYDLAEVHATIGEYTTGRTYFLSALQLAADLNHTHFQTILSKLAEQFPSLAFELSERQQQTVSYIAKEGAITRQQYINEFGVSKSQAHRDLTELVQNGVIQRVGKGRATRYEI